MGKKEKKKEKVETAVLSVSAKKKEAAEKEKKEEKKAEMDTEEKEAEKEEEKKEPKFCILENPTRVLPSQLKLLNIAENSKYKPVKSIQSGGIILVENTKPEEEEVLVERVAAGGPKTEENAKDESE